MPFNIKKAIGASEYGNVWVQFEGHEYLLVSGSGFIRVYNENGTIVYSSIGNNRAHLFVLGTKMFLIVSVNNLNSIQIFKWTGSAFNSMVAFANGHFDVIDFRFYSGFYYFLCPHRVVSGFVYQDGSTIFKFTGMDSGGLSIVKSVIGGVRYITSFDVDESTGDFIYVDKPITIGGGDGKIIKRTPGGTETELFHSVGLSKDIHNVRVYDGFIHYTKAIYSNPPKWILCKLDSFNSGAVETEIATDLQGRASTASAILYDGFLWIRAYDKVYRYITGLDPFLFDTIAIDSPGFILNFSLVGSELIQGDKGNFLTTAPSCNLAFGTPAYSKTNEGIEGANNGSITVNATSSFFIQYSLDNVTFYNSNTFTGLAPGTYTAYIKDTKGCTDSVGGIIILPFTVIPPLEPVPLSINLKPINFYNFITWFAASGNIAFEETTYYNCHYSIAPNGLPKPYRLNKPVGLAHYPWIVNSEQFSFYINFENDFSSPDFASFKLCIINETGVVQSDIAPLQRVFAPDGGSYFIYASVTVAGITPGLYRLAIYTGNDIVFVSQQLKAVTTDKANKEAVLLRYKATVNIYRYLYTAIPTFFHEIRLRMNEDDRATEGELVQYRSDSSGKLRNVGVDLDVVVKMELYYFDDMAHGAAQILPIHDYIFLNEKSYIAKALFKPDSSNKSRRTSKGTIEFYEQDFSMANRYGKKESLTVVGSDDPLLLGDGGYIKL